MLLRGRARPVPFPLHTNNLPGTFVTKARCLAAHRRTEPRAAARSARQPTMANRFVTLTGERHRDEYGQPEADMPDFRTSY